MKKLVIVGLAVLVFAAVAVYAAPEETETQEKLAAGQVRVVIPVEGMTCGSCCVKVETAMKDVVGIVAASADYAKGKATITYEEEKVTVQEIVAVINDKTSFKASMPKKTS